MNINLQDLSTGIKEIFDKYDISNASIEFFSTAKLIYSGIEVRKFTKIKLKLSIYKALVYKDHQQKH